MTTCQICARTIKSSKGLIAHHGYTRPDQGWQTNSCSGARYEPYEVSCDRLREIIEIVKNFIVDQEKELAEFLAMPPKTLTVIEKRGSYSAEKVMTYEKPDNFDPTSYGNGIPRTYKNSYHNKKQEYIRTIKSANVDLSSMQFRLANWNILIPAE